MVMINTDPYEPCPCGSGKKYKFCCKGKLTGNKGQTDFPPLRLMSELPEFEIDEADPVMVGDIDTGRKLCQKGLKLMAAQKFKEAISLFQQSHEAAPFIYTPANNMALCFLMTGQLDEAIRVQEDSLEESTLPNPFGLANLSIFFFIKGNEPDAENCINQALKMEMPSADACIKVCDALSRFKRHGDILKLADTSDYRDDPGVLFFTGIAAANLNNKKRAEADLRRVAIGYHKADMAKRYLQHLREKSVPNTVLCDWPYLLPYEICPLSVIRKETELDENAWHSRRIAVCMCESLLNESIAGDYKDAIGMLRFARHPDATTLLWAIVNGTFGPDNLRTRAMSILQERGLIKNGQKIEVMLGGKRTEVAGMGTQLNPEVVFGGELPSALSKLYTKALKAGTGKSPNWGKIGEYYRQIMVEAPAFYPAQYNYAISLVHLCRYEEALPILLELHAQHPEYLFAPATLLQIYTTLERKKDADQLIKSVEYPDETHPAAMTAWMVAQTIYHMHYNDDEAAVSCINMARQISPENPIVRALSRQLK